MRISHFFIDRPIFASVVSIIFVILGGVAFLRLPVAQYPEIAPPTITVSGQYPGASADIVASTVVTPIEQQINGVENMIYLSSNSTADGRFTISVTFDIGTNLDIAQVQVQNRVAIAQPRLPADVRNIGVTTVEATMSALAPGYWPDTVMVGGAISGYCATGSRRNATPPRITNMIETTEAKIGRSIKKCEMRIGFGQGYFGVCGCQSRNIRRSRRRPS